MRAVDYVKKKDSFEPDSNQRPKDINSSSTVLRSTNLRDFPQTKLDSEINAPFLLNELGDPRFFLKKEKKFDSRT